MRGLTISRTTDLPIWLNLAANVTILYLTFRIVEMNHRSLINSTRMVQLLESNKK